MNGVSMLLVFLLIGGVRKLEFCVSPYFLSFESEEHLFSALVSYDLYLFLVKLVV